METLTHHEKRRISGCGNFFDFLVDNRMGRNPRSLCIDCLAFLSHYQKIKHRMDHIILTPASFDSKEKYLALASENGWISPEKDMILIPLDKPPKWTSQIILKNMDFAPIENKCH